MNENIWYVYRHIRLDKNEVFYIGIGKKKNFSRAYSKHERNDIWNKITNKTDYKVEILRNELSFEEAKEIEMYFIKLYGKIKNNSGTLCNLTDGGDGVKGYKHSESQIEKYRQRVLGNKYNLGKKWSDESKKKSSQSKKGVPSNRFNWNHSEESKLKMSKKRLGKPAVNRIPVCDECTGEKYSSITEACKKYSLAPSSISLILSDKNSNNPLRLCLKRC